MLEVKIGKRKTSVCGVSLSGLTFNYFGSSYGGVFSDDKLQVVLWDLRQICGWLND